MITAALFFLTLLQIPAEPAVSVEVGGPITEALERLVTKYRAEEKQEMAGLLDRLRQRDDIAAQEFGALRDLFKSREEQEAQRYHGLRGLLEQIRDRDPGGTDTRLLPNLISMRAEVAELRASTGPIREALGMLVNLVYGLILLAGVLLVVDVYRSFFRKVG